MANYRNLTENLKHRLNPDNILIEKTLRDELSNISHSAILTYIRLAMKGVDQSYTTKSIEAGERVKEHLSTITNITFRYQGSVMTNTHIKGASDIDLLTITDKFYTLDSYKIIDILQSPSKSIKFPPSQISKLEEEHKRPLYQGDSLDDLYNLRKDSEFILRNKYSTFNSDNAKSIRITNLNLKRDVDVVTASWYDDITSIINNKGEYRGIQVYDKYKHEKGKPDYPFISIKRINDRSASTNGRLKRMIRFIKNIKTDSEVDIKISSFDINAICYNIYPIDYHDKHFAELVLIIYLQLKSLCTNKYHSDNLKSVDGNEYIFRDNSEKLENLKIILSEVEKIKYELNKVLV